MQIKDLQPKQGKVDITVTVIDKSTPKEFQKFGNPGKLCNSKVQDETGELAMTLWNEQVDQVNVGDKIKVTNGYVNEWQGEMQLSTGKFGKLEVVGKADAKASMAKTAAKAATAKALSTKDEEAVDDEEYDDEEEDEKEKKDEEDNDEEDYHDNIKEEEI